MDYLLTTTNIILSIYLIKLIYNLQDTILQNHCKCKLNSNFENSNFENSDSENNDSENNDYENNYEKNKKYLKILDDSNFGNDYYSFASNEYLPLIEEESEEYNMHNELDKPLIDDNTIDNGLDCNSNCNCHYNSSGNCS